MPPIVIVGQGRTGTTILYDLLAQDPATRVPLTWEVDRPCPPPETATYDTDPRIDEVDATLAGIDLVLPGFRAMHPMGARLAQECVRITALEFRSMIFPTQYRVPSYARWLLDEADMAPAYRWHRHVPAAPPVAPPGDRAGCSSRPATSGTSTRCWPSTPTPCSCRPTATRCGSSRRSARSCRRCARSPATTSTCRRPPPSSPTTSSTGSTGRSRRGSTAPCRPTRWSTCSSPSSWPTRSPPSARSTTGSGLELTAEAEARMRGFLAANPQDQHGGHRYTFAATGLDEGRAASAHPRLPGALRRAERAAALSGR